MWREVEQVLSGHRYELVLSGDKLKQRYEETKGIDETIWTLKQLNFLELSQCPLIDTISENISNLTNLSTLTFTSNNIRSLPNQLKLLINLRHLDLSNNQLKHLPDELFLNLSHLETINLSNNVLEDLPSFSSSNKRLSIINLSHNQLNKLEDFPKDLENLSHVDLSQNQFETFPTTLLQFHSLKFISVDSNKINFIPSQLSQIHRLKELRFKSNPIKDNRLKKLMEQDKLKATLEYLSKQWNDEQRSNSNSVQNKTSVPIQQMEKVQLSDQIKDKIQILHFDYSNELKGKQITILPKVTSIRPHILCCLARNLDLETPGHLKTFLNLQNELHDEICQKRTLATIGTHDLKSIVGNLVYDAREPHDIGLIPLGKSQKLISAKDFYDQLYRDAEHERKLKKRNQLSGLHKYLTLLEDKNEFPYLFDEDRHVISLPPLTNAERTKLTEKSESILIEITSDHSMDICRRVMDSILQKMLKLGLAKKSNEDKFQQLLILQQTKVVDDKGQLKTTFPSRTDLHWDQIYEESVFIERLLPEK